jgi:hypothetical protein
LTSVQRGGRLSGDFAEKIRLHLAAHHVRCAGRRSLRPTRHVTKRNGSDPTVNWDIIRKNATDEIILDFILSDLRADILEWSACRYAKLAKNGGVALYAISRRAYGDKVREFLIALNQNRLLAIKALASFEVPALRTNR